MSTTKSPELLAKVGERFQDLDLDSFEPGNPSESSQQCPLVMADFYLVQAGKYSEWRVEFLLDQHHI